MIVVFKSDFEENKVGQVKNLPDSFAQKLIDKDIVKEVPENSRLAQITKTRKVLKNTSNIAR